MKRVVVTGLGMVTPLGDGVDITWKRLLNSESGAGKITSFECDDIAAKIACQVPVGDEEGAFDLTKYMPAKDARKNDPFIVFGIAAAEQAIQDSGFKIETDEQAWRAGVQIGSGIGGLQTIESTVETLLNKGPRRVSPFFIPAALVNLVSGQVSIKHGLKGPNHSAVTACSTGAHAIGDASRLIQLGHADIMVAGGAEAACCRIGMAGFAAAKALSTKYNDEPTRASRPWDKGRDGFVMGEGAGVVVLEEYEHAKARGAKIYAEVKGYGLSGDAHHITAPAPDGSGGFRSMKMALETAGMSPEEIDYVNAHGTSTPLGDEIELGAVKRLFGEHAAGMSMSSTKSAIGHLLGAAGAVEAIFCIKALQNQIVPPTLNLEDPSENCSGIDLVPLKAKEREVRAALSNSFGFGGTNASLVMTRVED